MTNLTPEFLARLRALAEAATPGKWEWWTSCSWNRLTAEGGRDGGVLCPFVNRSDGHPDLSVSEEDMAFIAAAHPPTVLALLEAAEIGLEARRRMELGRTWRSALTCGCIFEDPYDLDLCTRSCDHHAGLLAELERLRAELVRHADLPQTVRSAHAD